MVQSTKSNPKKNLDLRLLFKNTNNFESKIKSQKTKTNNHPFLKFITRRQK